MQGANQEGAVVWGNASGNTSTITIKNSTVDGFAYLVGTNQRASKVILVENVIATNMLYLLRPLKTPDVTVKNVTCAAVIPVQFRAEAENCKLTIEDSTFESIEYYGSYYAPIQTHKGSDSIAYSIIVKGVNQFTKNGVDYEGTSWFAGTAGVSITVGAQVKTADNTFICGSFADAYEIAESGNTIKLLGNTTESAVIPYDIGFDYNGFTAENVTTEISRNLTLSGDITLNFYVNKTVVDVTEFTFGWADGCDTEFIYVVDETNSIYNIYKALITPQLMDKDVTLTVGGVSLTSSVVAYCDEALVDADVALTNLLVDLLNYGAAAQAYMGAEEVMDVSGYVGGTEFVAPANNYVKGTDVEGIDFGDSNVAFRNTNKLVWYFIVTDTTATVTIEKNGVKVVDGVAFASIAKKVTYMGVECSMIETDDIMATELDASYVLTVAGTNGTVTVEFSVADYVAYHANSNSADANLAKALWCYGQSAKAYNA